MKENQEQEFVVMAKPGPAFAVSREEFDRLRESQNSKKNREALEKRKACYRNFINIKDKTNKPDEKDFSL